MTVTTPRRRFRPLHAARLAVVGAAVVLTACATRGDPPSADLAWAGAQQVVLVTTPDWTTATGTLRTYTRTATGWRMDGVPTPVSVGRAGAGWGLGLHPAQSDGPQKREGDGRAPAGVFRIGTAFGYAPGVPALLADAARSPLPYAPMQASSWCVDVSASPLYNRIVDTRDVGDAAIKGSTEPMRRDVHEKGDQVYRMGFVIEHNPEGRKDAGSCIFAHLWRAPGAPTAGCTAMATPQMERLYGWLRVDARPVFVLLPEAEYARLQAAWDLPR